MRGLSRNIHPRRLIPLLAIFYVVSLLSFGFGYATLGRYDIRTVVGAADTNRYYDMVTGHYEKVRPPFRFRVMIPALARLVYTSLPDVNFGTWDPVFLSLLLVNAFFVSCAGCVLYLLGIQLNQGAYVSLIAVFLYVTSFTVVNGHLVGLIDSAEGLFLLITLLLCAYKAYWGLVIVIPLGVIAKETVIPFAVSLTFFWLVSEAWITKRFQWQSALVLIAATILSFCVLHIVRNLIGGPLYEVHTLNSTYLSRWWSKFMHCLLAREMVYQYAVLLPFSLPALRRLPRHFVIASLSTGLLALFLGTYADIQGSYHRPLFACAGPLLAIASSRTLIQLATELIPKRCRPKSPESDTISPGSG